MDTVTFYGHDGNTPSQQAQASASASVSITEAATIIATKDVTPGTPASLNEPGGQFEYTISVTNTSTTQPVTLDRICDDKYGTIATAARNPAVTCPAGSLGLAIDSTTCSLIPDVVLQPGGTQTPPAANSWYSCTFKASLAGNPVAGADVGTKNRVTDTVTFYGHDANDPPTTPQASDTAQVSITDTPPSATVTKAVVGIACAEVNYHVKVTNTDLGDANITLTALDDDGFGSLTSVHGDVLSTTCGQALLADGTTPGPGTLPATILKNGVYECDFTARFCSASHQNTVTAKIHDGDNPGTDVSQYSNQLTVNVSATKAP
jgi:hypothetical protein